MISKRLKSAIAVGVSALIACIGLVAIGDSAQKASAVSGASFDPGQIISDSVFFDFGTMSAADIQRFLNSQETGCTSKPGSPPCLKDYHAATPFHALDDGKCAEMPATTDSTAAQMIFAISQACQINPRVLLVTLQKEQGLIQASHPTAYMYNAAMGYGCPDSDPAICGKVWTGLFNQVYKAAGQFQWYGDPRGSFTYLRPGSNITLEYSSSPWQYKLRVDSSGNAMLDSSGNKIYDKTRRCPQAKFLLKNQATANLYYYTPYPPNQAALNNLYGSGDSCSAYGNRNFWRFYWDWFGSPLGGGFLLQSATSDVYLIVADKKYHIADPALVTALKPLGPLGEISQAYLDSFPVGGELNRLVKNGSNNLFFVDGGTKYPVTSCAIATNLGLPCASATRILQVQLDAMPTSAPMSNLIVNADGSRYAIQAGVVHEILDDDSAADANVTLATAAPVSLSAFSYLPVGAPIVKQLSLFVDRTSGETGVWADGRFYAIDKATLADFTFSSWLRQSFGTLDEKSFATQKSGKAITSLLQGSDGVNWLLTDAGKVKITDHSDWVKQAVVVPDSLLAAIPTAAPVIDGNQFVKQTGSSTIYLLRNGQIRPTMTAADRTILVAGMASTDVLELKPSAFSALPMGPTIIPAGTLVFDNNAKAYSVVDGDTRLVTFDAYADMFGWPKPRHVSSAQLLGYQSRVPLSRYKVSCAGQRLVGVDGKIYRVDVATAASYPGFTTSLSDATCALLPTAVGDLGNFVRTPDKQIWQVLKGRRHLVASGKLYLTLRGDGPKAVSVSNRFVDGLPIGKDAVAPKASPTPSPTVAPTPDPTSDPTKPVAKTYVIKSGDSLSSIATKFKTTVAKLMSLNGIKNANLISVGQKIKLP